MNIRNAFIITILLSPLCQASGRSLASSLLQGLLSSNPQLLKMAANKFQQASCAPAQQLAAPVQYSYQNPVAQYPQIIQTSYPTTQYPVPVQNVPTQPVVANTAPVVAKDTAVVAQELKYPAAGYSTVQTQTTYATPSKPCPFQSPAPLVNPFLPAASPISALCPPTSSLLPPANPGFARCQYLRKVPMPPPFL